MRAGSHSHHPRCPAARRGGSRRLATTLGLALPSLLASLLASALLVSGCATRPYPDLDKPDPLAADLPKTREQASTGAQGLVSLPASAESSTELAAAATPATTKTKLPDPPDPESLPPAKHRRIEIRLNDQRFDYFENGDLLWSGPISSGTRQHPTPKGRFRVQSKDIDKRSGSYTNYFNQPTPMPYSLQFHGPYFIHEGYLPDKPASHGCVRLRYEDAKFIYARMRVGDRVIVAN